MTVIDWISGVLLRPSATFERAQRELRLGYWWILLSVFTLEIVTVSYAPIATRGTPPADTSILILFQITLVMLFYDFQGLLLWAGARAVGWALTWREALKYIGLSWSLVFVLDIATFYPDLKGIESSPVWAGIPFVIWYLSALTAGLRSVSKSSWLKSLLLALIASLPWEVWFFWVYWNAWFH